MNAPITKPAPLWDIPHVTERDIFGGPLPRDQAHAQKPRPIAPLAGRTFAGGLNISDLPYMSKAILQMADENHEMRERIRLLESRLSQLEERLGL